MNRGPAQIALALDFLLNSLLWGDARQSLSQRTGKALARGKLWARIVAPIIDFIMRSKNHCAKAWADSRVTAEGT